MKTIVPVVARLNARAYNPWTPSQISGSRDNNFRENLKAHLKITSNNIPCMLTREIGNGDQVCAAHILPCSTRQDIFQDLSMDVTDLNSCRNGLFLAKNIELEFDRLHLSFVPRDVLNPTMLKMVIWTEATRNIPIWDGHPDMIGQYEGCTLNLGPHLPFRRALSYQAYQAHTFLRSSEIVPMEFGTPPSSFINMRSSLEAHLITSYREEVDQVEEFDS